jgi:hypothetical protein
VPTLTSGRRPEPRARSWRCTPGGLYGLIVRRALTFFGTGVVYIVVGVFFLTFLTTVLVSHDACVSRSDGEVHYGGWELNPLAWFGAISISETEVCEPETGAQYLVSFVPVVGRAFSEAGGGPSNPDYWANRDKTPW